MSQRKIDVVFYIPGNDDFGTIIPVARITPEQIAALQDSVAHAARPADACPRSISIKYEDRISLLNGGMCTNGPAQRWRTLEISDLFWLSNGNIRCYDRKMTNEAAMMHHCAKNLRNGKCQDEFMRNTVGRILFPQFYAKDKQK